MPVKDDQHAKEKSRAASPSPGKSPVIGSGAVLALDMGTIGKKLADAVQSTN